MKKKSKEKEYLYGYLDYVMNRFDAEFFDYENEFSYILNDKFFKIVILYEDIFADVTFLNIMLSYNVYYYQDLAEELGTEQESVMWPILLITQTLFLEVNKYGHKNSWSFNRSFLFEWTYFAAVFTNNKYP